MKFTTKYFIPFLFLSIVLLSCSKRPSNVLPEDKMVKLMVDMELAEAYTNNQAVGGLDKNELGKKVMELHGVSEETLDTTLAWYGRNMDEYTKLFDKVDKEIQKRRVKFTEVPGQTIIKADNLWPFKEHVLISPLSGSDNFSFSFIPPEVDKGEVLKFSFFLPNPTSIKGILGVEYTDGEGEATVATFSSKKNIEIEMHTDSSKKVARIFGIMNVKDRKNLPLFIDSISLNKEYMDTINYRSRRRNQKKYGVIFPQKQPEKVEIPTDSLKTDKPDSLKIDSIKNIESKPLPTRPEGNKESSEKKIIPKRMTTNVTNNSSTIGRIEKKN